MVFMNTSLPRINEETDLIEFDEGGRTFKLHPNALEAWKLMKQCAEAHGIMLKLISAFRSIERQKEIIENKKRKGLKEEEIFRINTPPGFSEHHSGRALDLGTDSCPDLDEEFGNSEAFKWLDGNGSRFGFRLSYPRNNVFGISYEPWHWLYEKPIQRFT